MVWQGSALVGTRRPAHPGGTAWRRTGVATAAEPSPLPGWVCCWGGILIKNKNKINCLFFNEREQLRM